MGNRYYYDEDGNRRSYHRDMLQMQRDQVKQEARDKRLTKQTKKPFNQNETKELTRSSTRQPAKKQGEEPVKVSKSDSLRSLITALNTKVDRLQARLDAASIDASCGSDGNVTVTLNL